MKQEDTSFTVFWKDGTAEVITGPSIAKAFALKGYGVKDFVNIAFHSDTYTVEDYTFFHDFGKWVKNDNVLAGGKNG